ncbi:DUF397 domain-containing protein [Streptomyces sp. NPDC026672]|uniref:DUF397 domain-containing protein n=1 Tax=unclassified Streptomyces TaxID=2593676 RepID=UPI0033EF4157
MYALNAAKELGADGWYKPWGGSSNGHCVEVKQLDRGNVAIRHSADPDGPALVYPSSAIAEFVDAAKEGKADFLIP